MDWTSPKDVSERRVLVSETIFGPADDPNREEKRFYVFSMGLPMGPGYRHVTSYNAFFHSRNRNRKRRNWTDRRLFYPTLVGFDPKPRYPISEPIVLADIYAFFEAIGYDYKKGKYLSGERMRVSKIT